LGGERVIFHYTSEQWVDFRELVRRLAQEYQTRIEMHQVNARDEARLVADYEKCGQHCCCRQFLKVLKPVSMRSAKVQKATLDPTKISGRCGRLMCCLRYEDETYEVLRKKLPHRQTRVITADGFGTVVDTQVLTQLALVQLDNQEAAQAYGIDTLKPLPKDQDPLAKLPKTRDRGPLNGAGPTGRPGPGAARGPAGAASPAAPGSPAGPAGDRGPEPRRPQPGMPLNPEEIASAGGVAPDADLQDLEPAEEQGADLDQASPESATPQSPAGPGAPTGAATPGDRAGPGAPPGPGGPELARGPGEQGQQPGGGRRRRRRRRRRGGGGGPPTGEPGAPGRGPGPASGPRHPGGPDGGAPSGPGPGGGGGGNSGGSTGGI
jgi:hypothetical protein